jgi:hypothetical protein
MGVRHASHHAFKQNDIQYEIYKMQYTICRQN